MKAMQSLAMNYRRYHYNVYGLRVTTLVCPPDRTYLCPIQVDFDETVNKIGAHWLDTVAGNVRLGIYKDNGDTPVGGDLLVESDSLAVPAGNNEIKLFSITETRLARELYWLAIQFSAQNKVYGISAQAGVEGDISIGYFDRAYGAFPSVCPAYTKGVAVTLFASVSSIP